MLSKQCINEGGAEFIAAVAQVLASVTMMARDEMANSRVGAPYRSKDQEDEQSDFSDTTHLDALHNTAGIANVVAGAYVGLDGRVKVLGHQWREM